MNQPTKKTQLRVRAQVQAGDCRTDCAIKARKQITAGSPIEPTSMFSANGCKVMKEMGECYCKCDPSDVKCKPNWWTINATI